MHITVIPTRSAQSLSKLCIFVVQVIVMASCGSPQPTAKDDATSAADTASYSTLDTQIDQYWDRFDFSNSAWIADADIAEQALVDYLYLLQQARPQHADKAIRSMLAKAKRNPEIFSYFTTTYQRYLYDPNSPMRNEERYESVLSFRIDSTSMPTYERDRLQRQLKLLRRNKPGDKAQDFPYQRRSGVTERLYDMHAPFNLVVFYEPGCPSCEETIRSLHQLPQVNKALKQGNIQILAIYATGNMDLWLKHATSIPSSWIDGIDIQQEILVNDLYDLKASPTLYLLDQNMRVILKDAPLPQILQVLFP